MSDSLTTDYVATFDERLLDLDKLIQTPNIIKEQALAVLSKLDKSSHLYATDRKTVEHGMQVLNNIQEGSIKNNYKVIYAQLCVLATSVLEAILKEYFENAISNVANLNTNNERLCKIRITAADLVAQKLKYTEAFAKLILENEKNEFQNLKKIKSLLNDYLCKNIKLTETEEKSIIFYLECRHVIVHKGSVVDGGFVRNVTTYLDANLKGYKAKDQIVLDEEDWKKIKNSYKRLVEEVTKKV